MKLGPVTELGKGNKKLSKNYNDVMSANCNVIFIFTIYSQFAAIGKPDFGRISVQLTFSLTITFYLTKTENGTKKNLYHSSHTIAISKGTIFAKKTITFCQKSADISKVKRALVLKGIFSKLNMNVYLRTEFQVSS